MPSVQDGLPKRDLRIDFFRGLAMYMILVDHIPGDPINYVTYQTLGFSDAAEIFVFLSGISCGIAYSRVLARSGWLLLITATTMRTAKIYLFYLLCNAAIIVLVAAVSGKIANFGAVDPALFEISKDPARALRTTIQLTGPPPICDILVTYIFLSLLVIPVFLAGARRSAELTLALSGSIWVASQFYPDVLPHGYFNPVAWQFLFCIGMFLGKRYQALPQPFLTLRSSRWVLLTAGTIVLCCLVSRHRFLYSHLGLESVELPLVMTSKPNLGAARLVHFISVALLVASFFTATNQILKFRSARPFTMTGRWSLEMFSLSTILSTAVTIIVAAGSLSFFARVGLDGIAILLMVTTVFALSILNDPRSPQPSSIVEGELPQRGGT